ncbi:MAG: 50S ribosomal protein L7/L12 [Deltaproteobacteria bacterium]|nr:50S ribosomal protein L7/L12 [Deltaproteobacteria bacterium]
MADLAKLAEELGQLTILEAAELIKTLEDTWDVKAASGGGMMMPPVGDAGGGVAEDQTEFDVELTGVGDKKIQVIKVVREITGLGLKDAKGVVDSAPKMVKEGISKADADAIKEKLEAQGATVTIK